MIRQYEYTLTNQRSSGLRCDKQDTTKFNAVSLLDGHSLNNVQQNLLAVDKSPNVSEVVGPFVGVERGQFMEAKMRK